MGETLHCRPSSYKSLEPSLSMRVLPNSRNSRFEFKLFSFSFLTIYGTKTDTRQQDTSLAVSENSTHISLAPDSPSYRFKSTGEPRKAVKARVLRPALPAELLLLGLEGNAVPMWQLKGGSPMGGSPGTCCCSPGPGDSRRRLVCGPSTQRRLSLPLGPEAPCPGSVSSRSHGEL